MTLDAEWTERWLRNAARAVASERSRLGALDREIGDGDHGENMDRGFAAVVAALDAAGPMDEPSSVLKSAAMTLISTVGGASGPLYGTALLRASTAVAGAAALDSEAVVAMLTAARDGVVARGKAAPGDKTMVDAWDPAVSAAMAAASSGDDGAAVLVAAAAAARAGAEATEPLVAHKGRASYLGERAIGHRDPGAESTALLLAAAADAAGADAAHAGEAAADAAHAGEAATDAAGAGEAGWAASAADAAGATDAGSAGQAGDRG